MKRIFSCIAVLLLLCCIAVITAASADAPVIGVSCPESVTVGETFDVYITVTEGSGIGGGKMKLNYDSSVLELLSITKDSLLSNATAFANNTTGKISWAGVQGITAGGNLFKASFLAKTIYADTRTAIYVSDLKVTDASTSVITALSMSGDTVVRGKVMPTLSIDVNEEVQVGKTFDVAVRMTADSHACGGKFALTYDNTKFSVVSADVGSALAGTTVFVNPAYKENAVRLTFAGITEMNAGGDVLNVTFRALDGAEGDAAFAIENCRMEDADGAAIEWDIVNAYVALVEELVCETSTTYTVENGELHFTTKVKNCFQDAVLVIALYKNGFMQDVAMTVVNGSTVPTVMESCDFDNIGIMLWDSVTTMRPLAKRVHTATASAELLEKLPDFSCAITVAADGVISDNNPVLPAKIDGTPITWTLSNIKNYAIVDNRIAVIDYTDIADEVLTLTASVQIADGYPEASRTFTVDTSVLRLGSEHVALVYPEANAKLCRADTFRYAIEVRAVETDGFSKAVLPVYGEIGYRCSATDADGNTMEAERNFIRNGDMYSVAETALIGSVNTVTAYVTGNSGSSVAVYTVTYTFTVVPRVHTVTYAANGGVVMANGKAVTSQTLAEDSRLCADLTVSRTGYTFGGWYADTDLSELFWDGGADAHMPAEDITLYAAWIPNTYTVTLNPNRGAISNRTVQVTFGAPYSITRKPTRTGYIFDGWYTAREGGERITTATVVSVAEDHTLYAHWTAKTYTVTFDACGGENTETERTVTYDTAYGTLPVPTRAGYLFDGWFTSSSSGTEVVAKDLVSLTADQTLYAHWTAHSFTLHLQAGEGTVEPTSITMLCGIPFGTLPTPTRDYYTFVGWYDAAEGGNPITEETVHGEAVEMTVYAQWSANNYTVTFDANGGNTSTASATVTYTGTYGTLPTPSRTGFGFNGWYTAASGGTVVYDSTTVSTAADHTLYAQWTPNTYKLEWYSDTNTCIEVERVASPYKGEWLGMVSYGFPIYYGDVLRVYYTASEGYELTSTGAVNITVTGNLHSAHIYSYARARNYTYDIVYRSSNGTFLGSTTATYAYGTTNTIYPPSFNGYFTPGSQSVKWDSVNGKTITFVYTPSSVSNRQHIAYGAWDTYYGYDYITYDVYVNTRNRTATSIEVCVDWTNTLRASYRYGYYQEYNACFGGNTWTPAIRINESWTWNSNVSYDRSQTASSSWVTVPVTAIQTTVTYKSHWWAHENAGDSGVIETTFTIPAY